MDRVLHGLTFKSLLCYLDDVLVTSSTFEQHIADLNEVFERFRNEGLKLSPKKCTFAHPSCEFLGLQISKHGISPPIDRVDAIKNYSRPQNKKSLRRFMGLMGWFRKFVPNFASISDALFMLLRKNAAFHWKDIHQTAFETLKQALVKSPVLSFTNYNLQFRLAVDTSSRGVGYLLYQIPQPDCDEDDAFKSTLKVIKFRSKGLSKCQRSYGPTKLELLGITTAVLDCSLYLRGRRFVIECDHQAP